MHRVLTFYLKEKITYTVDHAKNLFCNLLLQTYKDKAFFKSIFLSKYCSMFVLISLFCYKKKKISKGK